MVFSNCTDWGTAGFFCSYLATVHVMSLCTIMFICYTSVLEEEDVEYQITLIFELRVNSFGDPSAALHQGETQGIYVRFSVYFKFFTSRTKIGLEYEIKNGARIYEAHENH